MSDPFEAARNALQILDAALERRRCKHCNEYEDDHANAKCLFEPTTYKPRGVPPLSLDRNGLPVLDHPKQANRLERQRLALTYKEIHPYESPWQSLLVMWEKE